MQFSHKRWSTFIKDNSDFSVAMPSFHLWCSFHEVHKEGQLTQCCFPSLQNRRMPFYYLLFGSLVRFLLKVLKFAEAKQEDPHQPQIPQNSFL